MIFTGYGGVPCKTKDGLEGENCVGHKLHIPLRRQYELCCSFHEEQNPIINATRLGVNLFFGNINAYGINKFIRGNIRHLPIPVLFTRK
jgi:deoxycytidylate deaminase